MRGAVNGRCCRLSIPWSHGREAGLCIAQRMRSVHCTGILHRARVRWELGPTRRVGQAQSVAKGAVRGPGVSANRAVRSWEARWG